VTAPLEQDSRSHQQTIDRTTPHPVVLVAAKEMAPPQAPWMWRQISAMRELDRQLMYWRPEGSADVPAIGVPVHVLETDPAPFHGRRRWLMRAANLRRRNFYAARGTERSQIRRLIEACRPAALLCYYGEVALRTIDVAHEMGIPTIAYFHGGPDLAQNRWYRWSLTCRLDRFTQIAVVNHEEHAWMVDAGVPPERVHIIPCGAPTDVFVPAPRRKPGGIRFVMASRLVTQKGCLESIAAFAEVAATHCDASLDIYGDGPVRADVTKCVAAHGLDERVRLHGHVESAALAAALPRHDVFLQHSLGNEGSPVSIVEAMSCGLAVVTTAVGGNVDLVADGTTGFVVAQRDSAGMARAMLRLAGSEVLRDQMGLAARRRAVDEFDAIDLAGRLEELVLRTARR
jgi:glycosyltransferase involved in cell wall biosynthesis